MLLPRILDTIVMSLVLVVALFVVKQDRRPWFAFLFLVVYLVARIAVLLPLPQVLDFHPDGLVHNWIGHLLQIAWVLVFLWIGPLRAEDIGLTLKQRSGTILPAVVGTIGVIAFKGGLPVLLGGGPSNGLSAETLLFQITMPPLAQELLHSGLLLSLMIIALGGIKVDQEFDWTLVIVLAVLVNAFSHGIKFGLQYDPGLQFNIMVFMTPFIGKLVYAWLRLSTGSLLFPVLAYSLSNLVVVLIPYLLL